MSSKLLHHLFRDLTISAYMSDQALHGVFSSAVGPRVERVIKTSRDFLDLLPPQEEAEGAIVAINLRLFEYAAFIFFQKPIDKVELFTPSQVSLWSKRNIYVSEYGPSLAFFRAACIEAEKNNGGQPAPINVVFEKIKRSLDWDVKR